MNKRLVLTLSEESFDLIIRASTSAGSVSVANWTVIQAVAAARAALRTAAPDPANLGFEEDNEGGVEPLKTE